MPWAMAASALSGRADKKQRLSGRKITSMNPQKPRASYWCRDGLNIVKLLELLYHLVDSLTLLRSNVLEVVRVCGKLEHRQPRSPQPPSALDVARACRSHRTSDLVLFSSSSV